ncbi:hypothetical protein CS022_05660 [Veronia nyctiphanis]|uniref:Lipoprotein n=1 Tax=Veronia nyctiphanis TaxID=1278244 RepID=A0A4Q0YTQ6_9GAMM|nr:hypothetical protein [Veronia nyctiphanis]RXJ74113.1 hypothetical protein CS022_05660 [Veronia nyctiphanis]
MRYTQLTLIALSALSLVACSSTPTSTVSSDEVTANNQEKNNALELFESVKAKNTEWKEKLSNIKRFGIYSRSMIEDIIDTWEDAQDIYLDISADPAIASESYSLFSSHTYAAKYQLEVQSVANQYEALMELKKRADSCLHLRSMQ